MDINLRHPWQLLLDRWRIIAPSGTLSDAPPLELSCDEVDDLLSYLHEVLSEIDCDHTITHCREWAERKDIGWSALLSELDTTFECDCGVLMNMKRSPS
ncbi:DUF2695 domain-containing protein [Streptomyces sp. NPDC053431]|uniref:DUF2695 domain-containing protein n=1 Tax=Streptomyces sp. NPDC053431 TaxID=3365703 RepID=UPI0037D33210